MMWFAISVLVYALLVVAVFTATPRWLPASAEWRPYLASLPGIVLCGFFPILYFYMKRNDELVRSITTRALAVGCVVGLSTHIVSLTRASFAGYEQVDGATVVVLMALAFLGTAVFLGWKHR